MDFRRIRVIGDTRLTQFPLPRARLGRQDMAGKCMPALDFAGTRLFEPFGRTLMGLQLWHIKFPGFAGAATSRDDL